MNGVKDIIIGAATEKLTYFKIVKKNKKLYISYIREPRTNDTMNDVQVDRHTEAIGQ